MEGIGSGLIKVISQYLSGAAREDNENLRMVGGDSKRVPAEYKCTALLLHQTARTCNCS
jgi:hypothetical protein